MGTGDEKSVSILYREENGNLKFDLEALKSVLIKVGDRPIVIFSVNGAARTGKSFLLSNMYGCLSTGLDPNWLENSALDAFPWRNGRDCETKGIRISTQPLITKRYGREMALVLMDTEGSFDTTSTMNENAIIFAVSAILSSVMIFNVIRTIDEATLQFLSIFCNFASQAKGQGQDGTLDVSDFQKLIFLVRDFDFPEYKWGFYSDDRIPEKQALNFKKELLDPQPKFQSPEVLKTRNNLVNWFNEIGVFLMPDPGKGLRREDGINNLEPEFEDYLFKFMKCMISGENFKVKAINDREVTALKLLDRVSFLSEIFDGEKLPTVECIFQSAEKMQYQIEKSSAFEYYFKLIQEFPGEDQQETCRQQTITKFQTDSYLKDKEYFRRFKEEFNLAIEIRHITESYKEGVVFFKELLERAESLDTGCKIAKTTGTVASVGGALLGVGSVVCFALAPVTGGLTLGLGVAALSAGLAGGATKISSNVANKYVSEKLQAELHQNQTKRMELLQGILRRLDENVFFKMFKEKAKSTGEIPGHSKGEAGDAFGGNFVLNTAINTTGATANSTTSAMLIADAIADSAGTIVTASVREAVKRVAAGISLGFAAYEIYDLVHEWTPNHPLTPELRNLIQLYEDEISAWDSFSKNLEKSK